MMYGIPVIGPAHLGADYPQFDPRAINESRFPRSMRFKEYGYDDVEGGIRLNYVTQEIFTEEEKKAFIEEVVRAFRVNGCTGKLILDVDTREFDGEHCFRTEYKFTEDGYYEI